MTKTSLAAWAPTAKKDKETHVKDGFHSPVAATSLYDVNLPCAGVLPEVGFGCLDVDWNQARSPLHPTPRLFKSWSKDHMALARPAEISTTQDGWRVRIGSCTPIRSSSVRETDVGPPRRVLTFSLTSSSSDIHGI